MYDNVPYIPYVPYEPWKPVENVLKNHKSFDLLDEARNVINPVKKANIATRGTCNIRSTMGFLGITDDAVPVVDEAIYKMMK